MRCSKSQNLIDLYLADDPLLSLNDRSSLQEHLEICRPCRTAYEQGGRMVALIRQNGQISEDTRALLERGNDSKTRTRSALVRCICRTSAVAACLALGMAGWCTVVTRGVSTTRSSSSLVQRAPFTIQWTEGGSRIAPGTTIRTSEKEARRLVLNDRHQIVMRGGTELSIEPLVETGRTGCLVNLTLGEIYVHVRHDNCPFVVRTPQGRAIITGTTFDLQATDAGAVLMVAEGRVRFESPCGGVHVAAGQQSVIEAASLPPSVPVACDVAALTAWMKPDHDAIRTVEPATPGLALAFSVQGPTDVDISRVDFAEWTKQERGWFRQQFPWIFELSDALEEEGVTADYAVLLMQSGDVWRFAYPPADRGRQIEPDPNALLRAASCYGRDRAWLQRRSLPSLRVRNARPSLPPAGAERQAMGSTAFRHWMEMVVAQTRTCPAAPDCQVLMDSLEASLYLANTRVLAILAIREGFDGLASETKEEVLRLLQEELHVLADCAKLTRGWSLGWVTSGPREYADKAEQVAGTIAQIELLEQKLAVKRSVPQ